ncbi:MAG: hypothetical protein C0392_05850 [Syntrophus sp. (in: bacteria)]|nr:hypothetical protein [Syntrophus sp. (in: bacteria)]
MKIFALICLSFILFFNNLGGIALWDPDEPRQAIMAKEMAERNDYIRPYLNGKPYLEKPPLYSWMIIAASKTRGAIDEFASRVPSAIAATLLVLVTYALGSLLVSPGAGFISAVMLATNYQFLSNGREAVMDMTFAFFIGLTIFCAYLAIRRDKRWLFALSFLPGALAILTKGPAGLLIPVCTIFIYTIVEKKTKRFILPLVIGSLLAMAVAAIWFVAAGEAYIKEFLFRQNVTRFVNAFDHVESLFYYFHKLFFNFLPWSLILPFALYHGWKKKYWLPLVWFVFTFLFFEISTSKRAIYLLSCYPACALLCGFYLRDNWPSLVSRFTTGLLFKLFAGILSLLPLTAVIVLFTSSNTTIKAFREGPSSLYFYIGILFIIGAIFFYMLVQKSGKGAILSLFLYLTIAGFFYNDYYMPLMDRQYKSPRLITDHLKDLKKNAAIYTYGFSSAGFIYYVGTPIQTFFDINQIKEDKRDILLVIEDAQAPAPMRKVLETEYKSVGKSRYEKEYYTFYVRNNGR